MIMCAVIPARLASTRLPRKVLADINGHPLLWHVWQQVSKAKRVNTIYVATDSIEISTIVESWGGRVIMTSPACRSGTERIASVLDKISGDFIINVQGDEPFIDPDMLDKLVVAWEEKGGEILTPIYSITALSTLLDPNVVKVVRNGTGQALYFSRNPIPYVRDLPQENWLNHQHFWGHVGVYGYRRDILAAYHSFPESLLEKAECLEQLRLLEAGIKIQTIDTDYRPIAVDTLEDLKHVRQIIGDRQ